MGAGLNSIDCAAHNTREINGWLQQRARAAASEVGAGGAPQVLTLLHPDSRHNLAVGLLSHLNIVIDGPVGYYCGGLCEGIELDIRGGAGWGLAENLMQGRVILRGSAGSAAGSSMHGGLLAIHGSTGARCGAAMKGGTIVVQGDVGIMSAFMMQKGALIIGGDAGEALGDSIYEGIIYLRGRAESLGADAHFVDMTPADSDFLAGALDCAELNLAPGSFKKIASARRLYNFDSKDKEIWREAL